MNNRAGEMEETFLRYFCMSSNLRAFMQTIKFPEDNPAFAKWAKTFPIAMGRPVEVQEFHLQDASHFPYEYNRSKEVSLPDIIYEGLLCRVNHDSPVLYFPWRTPGDKRKIAATGQRIRSVEHFRTKLSSPERTSGNSFIAFTSPYNQDQRYRAGQICDIFLHRRVDQFAEGTSPVIEPFLVVREYVELSIEDQIHDPYHHFEHLDTSLRYNRFKEDVHVLRPCDVLAHFASYVYMPPNISEQCVVVCLLDRFIPVQLLMESPTFNNTLVNDADSSLREPSRPPSPLNTTASTQPATSISPIGKPGDSTSLASDGEQTGNVFLQLKRNGDPTGPDLVAAKRFKGHDGHEELLARICNVHIFVFSDLDD
ncbi:hypothetical protein OF83DRAFT_1088625 [Amylostereum chailletii]|nr:hypothetical protein OF83DRAFT_1088625 [Amylostereum chailletii]